VRPFPQVRLYAEDTKMTLAVVMSRALDGLEAPAVRVEVHLANGLPSFTLVGLADTEVKEARERVRAALSESGFAFPHNQRVTVNLAPADLPKESGRFDLPIALGILAASGVIDPARLQTFHGMRGTSALGFLGTTEHPTEGTLRTIGTGATWHEGGLPVPGPAPRLGEHTDEVLRSLSGAR
jgi:magnesium chelatase family protein